jgi:hypothetical protein
LLKERRRDLGSGERISTPQIYLLADPSPPLHRYKGKHGQKVHPMDQRGIEGARNDEHGDLAAARGDGARGGVEPAEEGVASEPQETRHRPIGLDRGVGVDRGGVSSRREAGIGGR